MEDVTAVFPSSASADRAAAAIRAAGLSPDRLRRLDPSSSEKSVHTSIPTSDTEPPGAARAIGAVVGAVAFAAAALAFSGLIAAALAGLVGALAGGAAARALERRLSRGLPKDEIYRYESELREGKTVLFFLARDADEAERARRAMTSAGAASLDEARHEGVDLDESERAHPVSRPAS